MKGNITGRAQLYRPAFAEFDREMSRRLASWQQKLEIMAIECAYSNRSSSEYAKPIDAAAPEVEARLQSVQVAPTSEERELAGAFEAKSSDQMNVMQRRAAMVVKVQEEIKLVRPLLKEDSDYSLLKEQHPDFILFEICEQDPELKELLLGINRHHQRKALRFAKQVSAAKCNIKLNTIEKAWDLYNPDHKPRVAQSKTRPKAPGQKTHK
jgi:hypothetical protein